MSYDNNLYYNPDKSDLTIIGEIDWDEESYQFNMTVVWIDNEGQYYMGSDSGCSCPCPFEDFTSVSDLDGPYDANAVEYNLIRRAEDEASDGEGRYSYGRSRAELMKDVRAIVSRL